MYILASDNECIHRLFNKNMHITRKFVNCNNLQSLGCIDLVMSDESTLACTTECTTMEELLINQLEAVMKDIPPPGM